MLVPFIATPLAGKVEKKMNERADKKSHTTQTQKNSGENKSNPTMKGAQQIKSEQASEPASQNLPEQTGSTNLLQKYKNK